MRFKASSIVVLTIVSFVMLMDAACKKTNPLTAGGVLKFSEDTLKFDTVFTTQGSFTSGVMIYNPQGQEVIVSNVRMRNGAASYFHLNVDGFSGNNISNIKIAPHDSVYVFATVKIDPSDTLTPFIVTDNLIATMNGKDFSIPFTAYGQNAYFHVGDSINTTTTWKTDKPHVVMHSFVVGPGTQGNPTILYIPHGCKVYMHQDARFVVYGGLGINLDSKSAKDSLVIQGDRLDRGYYLNRGFPGEWGGILVEPYGLVDMSNTIIKNCGNSTQYAGQGTLAAAIEVDSLGRLYMDHSTIKNSIGYGILALRGKVVASNCLVHTCGAQAFANIVGGTDSLTNCTFANYGSVDVSHINQPVVAMLSYYAPGGGQAPIPGTLSAVMTNCIVYGSLDSEFYCDNSGGGSASIMMDHCLFGTGWQIPAFVTTKSCKIGQAVTGFIDPKFLAPNSGNFMISASSPAVDAGLPLSWITDDLTGKIRSAGGTTGNDMGCFQH